ncbi:MAG: glycosyltransferase family 4 protein [Bacteroidota bacterium]|nr:glycosyltransferase family 4 protein [Bacteroidota bacterium]
MSDRIRVVHIVYSLGMGGVETIVSSICSNMDPERFDVHIISFSDHTPLYEKMIDRDRVKLHTLGREYPMKDWHAPLKAEWRLWKTLKKIDPDLIHGHIYYVDHLLMAYLLGKPHVLTFHGPSMNSFRNRLRQQVTRWCNNLRENASRTVCVSQSTRRYIAEHFHDNYSSVSVVRNGVDTSFFAPINAPKAKIKRIGNISRQVSGKGLETLIEAWGTLSGNDPSLSLQLAGNGNLQKELKMAADKWPNGNIDFLGETSDPKRFIEGQDLLVFPSEHEGLPMAPLEVMSMGIPILLSDIPPHREIAGDFADHLLFKTGDAKSLISGIQRWIQLSPGEIAVWSENLRNRIQEEFSLTGTVQGYQDLYQQWA